MLSLVHGVPWVAPRLVPLQDGRRTEGALAPPPRDVVPAHEPPSEAEHGGGCVVEAGGERDEPVQPQRRATRHLELRWSCDGDARQRLRRGDEHMARCGGVAAEAVSHLCEGAGEDQG